jgi:peptidoglycan/xylan/chitin deacetylase (PgdA/CDA1 family)
VILILFRLKNVLLIQPKLLVRKIYPRAIWNYSRTEKNLYLTFDDGPIPGLTEWVMDELKKYGAKATFFCVGANILKHPDIFEKIKAEGHTVANHTMHHIKGFKHNVAEYLKETEECRKLTGNDLFRPPYGQLKRSQYRALSDRHYKIVLWDVISYDYENIPERTCAENVINNSKNGSIVLFHDNWKAEKNMKYALPLFLEHFAKLNYQFNALEA